MAEILVIGGGAAGMMAAVFAAKAGANVTLLEKNEKLGKKVYITGKGRCNLTNDCDLDEFLSQVSRNPRFLYSALSFFSSRDMISLMEENGCPVTVQRGKRVFPASEKASDVTKALAGLLRKLNVRIRLNADVRSLRTENGRISGAVLADETFLPADAVILACGGLSYPSTGSTGDGFRFAEALGHTVVLASPVLVGLETEETWPKELQGLSLRNVTLNLTSGKKTLYSELGEMLFTHFGISGPLALEQPCGNLPQALRDLPGPALQPDHCCPAGNPAHHAQSPAADRKGSPAHCRSHRHPRRCKREGNRARHHAQQTDPQPVLRRRNDRRRRPYRRI